MSDEVLYTRRQRDGMTWVELTLNRPEKGNALTEEMLATLQEHIDSIRHDREVSAVVLRGNGRFFCTGGDIAAWGGLSPHAMAQDWILRGIEVFENIASLPQPVIAAIHGHAIGGGLELALAADLRIAVGHAKLGTPEVTLNMIAGWGGIRRLAETIGPARARHMTLLGTLIPAEQALTWGLLTAVAEDAESLEAELDRWLLQLLQNGPIAMARTKGILATMHSDMRHHHASAAAELLATADCKEGVEAFLAKRKPAYRNH